MNSHSVISVENLGKSYSIKTRENQRYVALRDEVARFAKNIFRSSRQKKNQEEFWALKDVSFEVKSGEVLGIIGRNGAGKSTLLKVLSRITEPSRGRVRIKGRVASLLEVGTGFHPELTGRENVYLSGAILGMSRAEIKRKFDEIVDFAEVSRFLETPVKRYSSGMYVRLAFAVAAHLEAEILVVDEVLAVGDADFQNKCLGKMQGVASGGRTVLLVSHQLHSISLLCSRAILFEGGLLKGDGPVQSILELYSQSFSRTKSSENARPIASRRGTGEYRFVEANPEKETFDPAEIKRFNYVIQNFGSQLGKLYLSALLFNESGFEIGQFDSRLTGFWMDDAHRIQGQFLIKTPWLKPGRYRIDLFICVSGSIIDWFENACEFSVSSVLPYKNPSSADGVSHGLVFADYSWSTD